MRRETLLGALVMLLATPAAGQDATVARELHDVMAEFVRGWREGDRDRLSRVVAVDEGRVTWVGGAGDSARVHAMTFRDLMARNRTNPDYGLEGWEIESIDVVDDQLAFVRLRVLETNAVNIDYMVLYRVDGRWRIVSNTFVILNRE